MSGAVSNAPPHQGDGGLIALLFTTEVRSDGLNEISRQLFARKNPTVEVRSALRERSRPSGASNTVSAITGHPNEYAERPIRLCMLDPSLTGFDPKATFGRSAIEPVGCIYRRAAHPLLGESGRICKSSCGEIDICPANGRSWAAIRRMEAATPVANSASETRPARGSSQWTKAIATRAHTACSRRHDHFTMFTWSRLTRMRCRRASSAVSREPTISR